MALRQVSWRDESRELQEAFEQARELQEELLEELHDADDAHAESIQRKLLEVQGVQARLQARLNVVRDDEDICPPRVQIPHNQNKPAVLDGPSPFTVEPLPGKGFGLLATRQLPFGSTLLLEKPVLRVARCTSEEFLPNPSEGPSAEEGSLKRCLDSQFALLDDQTQDAVMALADCFSETKSLAGIFYTNSLPAGEDIVLCPTASRLNSSCRPNAVFRWCELSDCIEVKALRDMEPSEEICIYYAGDLRKSTMERHETLLRRWQFRCDCKACSDLESDERRQLIAILDADLASLQFDDMPLAYEIATTKLELYEQEELFWNGYLQALHDCLVFGRAASQPSSVTQLWAVRALKWVEAFFPDNLELVKKYESYCELASTS